MIINLSCCPLVGYGYGAGTSGQSPWGGDTARRRFIDRGGPGARSRNAQRPTRIWPLLGASTHPGPVVGVLRWGLGAFLLWPPSAVLALSFSLLSQLSNPSHHMGTTRSFDSKLKPGKYDLVGVNCEDGSSEEGDILFTMPPKYELAY